MRTRGKTNEKHQTEKSPATPTAADCFSTMQDAKTISEFSSASQLFAITGLTDAELRRLANPNNPDPATGTAWIPKPVRGQYATIPTLAGIVSYLAAAAPRPRVDHPVYVSMDEAETRGLIPREAQKFAQRQGINFINANRSVDSEKLRRFLFDLIKKIFAKGGPNMEEIQSVEVLDKNTELAKKLREERIALAHEREQRDGIIVYRDVVDEEIYEKRLGPARAAIEASHKNLKRQLRTIISGDGTTEEKITRAEAAITERFDSMLKKMAHDSFEN